MAPARWERAAAAQLDALRNLVEQTEAAADGDDTVALGLAWASFNAARKRSFVETDHAARSGYVVTPDEIATHCGDIDALSARGAAAQRRLNERLEAMRPSADDLAASRARVSAEAVERRSERIEARRMARESRKVATTTAPVLDLGRHRVRQVERNRLAEAVAAVHLAVGDVARVDALHTLRKVALEVGDTDYAAWARKELRHAGHAGPHAADDVGRPSERVFA